MFDFRYHALSIAAVFLALGIGIVLGVTIGDSLVSRTEQTIRSSLRQDVSGARDEADRLRRELARRDQVIEQAVPPLVDGRLKGTRVAVVAFGSLPDGVRSPVEDGVKAAGGSLDSTSVLAAPPDERALGNAVGGRFRRLGSDKDLLQLLADRIGRSIVRGGPVARRLERSLGHSFAGDYRGADAVVVYHAPGGGSADTTMAFERALIDGLRSAGVPVVGVERGDTDPSQIGFYGDNGLSSVDSVDVLAGRAALVFALDGARGAFGFKDSADEPLPKPPPLG